MIISLLNQKGGVGKTTLAVHIAMGLAQTKRRVLLIDADPQGSALQWAENRDGQAPFSVIGIPNKTIHKETPRLSTNYDAIVIDGPPRVYEVARSAAHASDLILMPVQPSPYDVWASEETVKLVKEAQGFKDTLKTFFVINRKIINTVIARDVTDALAGYELPVMNSQLCQRVSFAETAGEGRTVLEVDPNSQASEEVRALVEEVLEVFE